jgi:hypothetical protein
MQNSALMHPDMDEVFRMKKLDALLGDDQVVVNFNTLSPEMRDVMTSIAHVGVFTGSVVLKLYGLLERSVNDFDLYVTPATLSNPAYDYLFSKMNGHDSYGHKNPSIGYIFVGGVKVDIFEDNGGEEVVCLWDVDHRVNIMTYESILYWKEYCSRTKDKKDIEFALSVLIGEQKGTNQDYATHKTEKHFYKKFLSIFNL